VRGGEEGLGVPAGVEYLQPDQVAIEGIPPW
jgi:hypothetical protein